MTSAPRKVLHLIDSGGVFGAENVVLALSQEMRRGGEYRPIVGCVVDAVDDKCDLIDVSSRLGIDAVRIVVSNRSVIWHLPRAAIQTRRLGVDIIHSHGYKPSVFGYLFYLLTRVSVMATCHLWFEEEAPPLKQRLMLFLERIVYRRFPCVVGVSDPIANTLVSMGVERSRVRVVDNGILMDDYVAPPKCEVARTRKELGLKAGDYAIVACGRLTRQKAHSDLIQAGRILRDRDVACKIFIAGSGELHDRLQRQIQEADLHNAVVLLGFRDDVRSLLHAADLFVLPSLDEGMPIALLEAVATRTPVVVTPVGDVPKLVQDGITGTHVRPSDPAELVSAVVKSKDNQSRGRAMADSAWELMKESYSSGKMYREYSQVYDSMLLDRRVERAKG